MRNTLVVLAVAALAGGAFATPASAAPQGECEFSRTLCLFDQEGYGGARFTVNALDPQVGTCVNLVEHGWGAGRAKSGINTNTQRAAVLFPNADCTGRGWPVNAGSRDPRIGLPANGVYVY
ncbi:hypothetical protein JOF53_000589 [Crossiella equi]|uniref:Peptidase inhibitor family I36 n=1 Tax=Crossiella equi TaxID=130796 RepID=A0ABS5A647_9PSEU|nr:peptidase inhibitor family I36 protein [Crossiella equi]MBP2471717.1 hypothetical protein [Crossiella equi]